MTFKDQRIKNITDEELRREQILRDRINDPDKKKMFRNGYVFKAGWDYSTLNPYCENIIQATEGYADHIDRSRAKIELNLRDYDSDKDVIAIVGRAFDNLIVGTLIAQKVAQKPVARQSFAVAVYFDFSYTFYQVFLDSTIETYEIIK